MKNTMSKFSTKTLVRVLLVLAIIAVTFLAFVGIYKQDKTEMVSVIPDYKFGRELDKSRYLKINLSEETTKKYYLPDGTETTDSTAEGVTAKDVLVNTEEMRTEENYNKTVRSIKKRLETLQLNDYTIALDKDNGSMVIEYNENSLSDYMAQYAITPGKFSIVDAETNEVLVTNSDVSKAFSGYVQNTADTYTVYFEIDFNGQGTKKLEDMSRKYVVGVDENGNTTTKKVKMMLDDTEITETYFSTPVTDGVLQMSIGSNTTADELERYLVQARNIVVFINSDALPLEYEVEINRVVYSDITAETLTPYAYAGIGLVVLAVVILTVKFKMQGLYTGIVFVGYVSLLLLGLRLGNVELETSGLVAIVLVSLIELSVLKKFIVVSNTATPENKKVYNTTIGMLKVFVPIVLIADIFALSVHTPLTSFGNVLFWGLLLAIYDFIVVKPLVINTNKGMEEKNKEIEVFKQERINKAKEKERKLKEEDIKEEKEEIKKEKAKEANKKDVVKKRKPAKKTTKKTAKKGDKK